MVSFRRLLPFRPAGRGVVNSLFLPAMRVLSVRIISKREARGAGTHKQGHRQELEQEQKQDDDRGRSKSRLTSAIVGMAPILCGGVG